MKIVQTGLALCLVLTIFNTAQIFNLQNDESETRSLVRGLMIEQESNAELVPAEEPTLPISHDNSLLIKANQVAIQELSERLNSGVTTESEVIQTPNSYAGLSGSNKYIEEATRGLNAILPAANTDSSEDWYWNSTKKNSNLLSIESTDSFDVHSMDCRGGWCRVEIQKTPVDGEALTRAELHLDIDDALGRDSTIRWGNSNSDRMVLFIK